MDNVRKFEKGEYSGHSWFLNDVLSHLSIRQTLRILLNEKITGFIHFKPKHHWDLMLKMVFRHNDRFLFMFMDGLYLDNDFPTLFLSFYCFYCCGCFVVVVVVVVVDFTILL